LENYNFKYLVKVDDDSFFRINKLLEIYRYLRKERTYIGTWRKMDGGNLPASRDPLIYAGGAGYILSADMIEYLAESYFKYNKSFSDQLGAKVEDAQIGIWLSIIGVRLQYYPIMFECHPEGLLMHKVFDDALHQLYNKITNSTTSSVSMCDNSRITYERDTQPTLEDLEALSWVKTSQ